MTSAVGDDDEVVFHQTIHLVGPDIGIAQTAVDQEDGLPTP